MNPEHVTKLEELHAKKDWALYRNGEKRLGGYHCNFDSTGNDDVDMILSTVACADKSYHYTEDWENEYGGTGMSHWEMIQAAADRAATRAQALERRIELERREKGATIHRLAKVIEDNAHTVHEAHHTDMKGTWRDCARYTCMGADLAIRGVNP